MPTLMGHLTHLVLLAILAVFVSQLKISEACSCQPLHPQMHYCYSDFVAIVRVKEMVIPRPTSILQVSYRVKLQRIFKATPKARKALERKHLRLWSPSPDSACERYMDPGETWVLSGRLLNGKPYVTICDLGMRWSTVSPRQRKGFRHLYRQGCDCQILYTQWWRKGAVLESTGGKRCLWESLPGPQDCQEQFGVCMVGTAGCSWVPSVAYKKCIMQHQSDRVQQRAREP